MDDKELQMYQTFYDEALATPMDFIIHDCNASYDDKLREAAADGGWGFYGMWWRLVELLTAKDGHFYDVSDERGWRFLAYDMSNFCPVSTDECRAFVTSLVEYGLLDRESFAEFGHVASRRVVRNCVSYAEKVAKSKLGSWKTNQKKQRKAAERDAERDA